MKNKTKGIILILIPIIALLAFMIIMFKGSFTIMLYFAAIIIVVYLFTTMIVHGAELILKDKDA
jgi:hypothetical protein